MFKVSNIGYILYANGKPDEKEFNGKLSFDEHLYPLVCDTEWIDKIIIEMYECLNSDKLPKVAEDGMVKDVSNVLTKKNYLIFLKNI